MKKVYIIPKANISDSCMPSSVICASRPEYDLETEPQSGNGGNAQGGTGIDYGGTTTGPIYDTKRFYTGFRE